MAPRRAAQHTVFILRIVPILAPLPHIASHIIQPILICREAPDRTRPRVPIFIPLDHGTAFRFVSNPRLLSAVITRSRRRRPLRTPWIKVYLGTLLFRRISGFRIQSHCYTPFNVGRQPVVRALGQRTRTAFSLGQPFAKRFHIVQLTPTTGFVGPCLNPGSFQVAPRRFHPLLTNRVHAFRRVVAGSLDECIKVLQARIPNVEQHLRPGDRHEFHP
jgi:hypothetical protein